MAKDQFPVQVVVIGAGVIGLSIALAAQDCGFSVTVFDLSLIHISYVRPCHRAPAFGYAKPDPHGLAQSF